MAPGMFVRKFGTKLNVPMLFCRIQTALAITGNILPVIILFVSQNRTHYDVKLAPHESRLLSHLPLVSG